MDQDDEAVGLELLASNSRKKVSALQALCSSTQIELSKERTQYFEKLVLGCGATIALVVSYLGSQHPTLEPKWLLRTALVALGAAMLGAMYRNWIYPRYVLSARYKELDEALLENHRNYGEFARTTPLTSLQTGRPASDYIAHPTFGEIDAVLTAKIKEFKEQEDHIWKNLKWVEPAVLFFAATGIILLVVLAWINF